MILFIYRLAHLTAFILGLVFWPTITCVVVTIIFCLAYLSLRRHVHRYFFMRARTTSTRNPDTGDEIAFTEPEQLDAWIDTQIRKP